MPAYSDLALKLDNDRIMIGNVGLNELCRTKTRQQGRAHETIVYAHAAIAVARSKMRTGVWYGLGAGNGIVGMAGGCPGIGKSVDKTEPAEAVRIIVTRDQLVFGLLRGEIQVTEDHGVDGGASGRRLRSTS